MGVLTTTAFGGNSSSFMGASPRAFLQVWLEGEELLDDIKRQLPFWAWLDDNDPDPDDVLTLEAIADLAESDI